MIVETQPVCCFEVLCSIEGDFNVTECDDSVVWSYSIIEDGSLNGWTRPRSVQPLSVSTRRSAVVQTQLGIRDSSAETASSDSANKIVDFHARLDALSHAQKLIRG